MPQMPCGAFGENLTIAGLSEESVCIGDIFRIGTVTFEVSQPRQPCWKLARRWRMHELTGLVVRNGRSGWYLRVLEQGWIEAQMEVFAPERVDELVRVYRAHNEPLHDELERPRRIVFTMFVPGYSVSPDRVAVQIHADDDGCALALTHAMRPEYAPYVAATVDAYREHLRTLEALLA